MIVKTLPTIGKAVIGVALCVSSVPAIANPACALSLQGCVLPVQETVAAPVVTPEAAPAPVIVDEAEPKSLGILPILAGLAALGALAWLVLDDDDDDEPESP